MTRSRASAAIRSRPDKLSNDSLEHSQRHISALYEISKQLTRFEDIEIALPRIVEIIATRLPLRTTICIRRHDDELMTWSWSSPIATPEDLHAARLKAQNAYAYLTGHSTESQQTAGSDADAEVVINAPEIAQAPGKTLLLTLPLVVERAPAFGVFQLGALFMEPTETLDKVDLAFANAVANQLAIAIDRQRAWGQVLHKAQLDKTIAQSKQVEAELSEKRERLLSAASALLGRSLDYNANIEAVARLLVPTLADWCMIDMIASVEPELIRIANTRVAYIDKNQETRYQEIARPFLIDPKLSHGVAHVVRTSQPEIQTDATNVTWIPSALGLDNPPHLQEIGAHSYMCVPLKGRGGVVGTITLVCNGSGRRYTNFDLELAENFAWRAAAAIDNAKMYENSQNAIRVRDDLLGIVSHDLRNPLSLVILHAASLMKKPEIAGMGDPIRKEIEGIRRSAERMQRLIQDLLDSASIDAGHVSIERQIVAIGPLISEAIEAFEPLAAGKALRLEVKIAPDVPDLFADPVRVLQILTNLMSNAIKFTPAGGCVSVGAERQGDFVRFEVTDTGPGIPEIELPHLFDRFWQARQTAGLGTGLGLFISKALIEMQGGRVWVESVMGRGTTFYFIMPVASPMA
jgi:signal transduction histidine kinase